MKRPPAAIPLMLFTLAFALAGALPLSADDWPVWRHDAAHSASTPTPLPERLRLQWSRQLPQLRPGWLDQPRVQMDAIYEPIVVGRTMFVSSERTDSVSAFDTRTGEPRWRFLTDGPVRYSPVAWEGRLYFTSDDGHLYCVGAEKGELLWKFRGGPSDRLILGNERLISTWPARGAPVVADGTVYFGAGIWPFMGIFLHALDARTGKPVWTNEGDGSLYIQQPHNVDSFAGVAPQGPMVAVGERLLVAGGRSVPACYDRKTGKLSYFKFADNGRRGGVDVAATSSLFFSGGLAYDLATGVYVSEFSRALALGEDLICYGGKKKDLLIVRSPTKSMVESVDRKGEKVLKPQWKMGPSETMEMPLVLCLARAGDRVYAGSEDRITSFDLGKKTKEAWRVEIEGAPASLIAADDRLFVVTTDGWIHCFGAEETKRVVHRYAPKEEITAGLSELPPTLKAAGIQNGYCVSFQGEVENRHLLAALNGHSMKVVFVLPGAARVAGLRAELLELGLSPENACALQGTAKTIAIPPYFASAIEYGIDEELAAGTLARLFQILRPYGGKLFLLKSRVDKAAIEALIAEAGLQNARLEEAGECWALTRAGALPGAADWTHEHADPANTRVSKDSVVKAPLGLLWFGGTSHEGILPRHGHGPQPQIIEGRLILEGVDKMRATDIYTGRLLWESSLPGVGDFYNNVIHQPGANSTGSNFVSMPDGIYVAWKKKCVKLDPASGKIVAEFPVPGGGDSDWSCITAAGEVLVGGAEPLNEIKVVRQEQGGLDDPASALDAAMKKLTSIKADNDSGSSSRRLFALDRASGKLLWEATARAGFRHNSICIGNGKLFVIDRLSGPQAERLKKKGEPPGPAPLLLAFDLKDGRELWRSEDAVFGTFLSYSEPKDVLLESGRVARDTVTDESKNMRAHRGEDGKVLWHKGYSGPGMILGDTVLAGERACNLMTGAPRGRLHPITGQPVEWTWTRNYGCNTPAASQNLLTFRSGAAGYFDLAGDGGTGNFGGFKSGCTNNLIVAGGLLNAPDYTRTCICSYQNQASLGLVPMPEVEMWTFFGSTEIKGAIQRVGINLGAPGDRRAENGTLWVEHPPVGGKSPAPNLAIGGDKATYFRRNAMRMSGEGLPWVAASGVKDLTSITLTLDKDAKDVKPYTLRLTFSEPDGLRAGERVFDVAIQNELVLKNFDIAAEAGGPDRSVVREFVGIGAAKELKVKFLPRKGGAVLCGLEVVSGGTLVETRNVVESTLTVPESASSLLKPRPEDAPPPAPMTEATGLGSLLWIGAGALFLLVILMSPRLFRRRSA